MDDISCNVCMDLIPLVKDGVASEDSRRAVEAHLSSCPACRSVFDSGSIPPPEPDSGKLLGQVQHRLRLFFIVLLCFGVFFGVSLTASSDGFYNSLIMPILGILGYCAFRWKALWSVPLLLLAIHAGIQGLSLVRGAEHTDIFSLLMWTAIYSILAVVGTVIAGLFHYAFRKEN